MIQTRAFVAPSSGAAVTPHLRPQSQISRNTANSSPLHFDGPVPKTPVSFQGRKAKEEAKRQNALQTALQEASILMTVPVLLGVSGISYLTGEEKPELILVSPTRENRLNLLA